MTESQQHLAWLAAGAHWELCTPARLLRDTLRAAGFTVYDLGNDEHLDHQPPEDHTPYSATGWPGASPHGVVMAIDIMPGGPVSLQTLGAQLHADKQSGRYPPIKYMNWGPVDDDHAVQCRWKPDHAQDTSSDTGHIHISFRTDYVDYDVPYNPLGDDMALSDIVPGTGTPGTGGKARSVQDILHDEALKRAVWIGELTPAQAGYGPNSPLAKLVALASAGPTPPTQLTDEQVAAIGDKVAAAVVAHPDNPLGDADKPAIVAAVKQALAEGVGVA